MKIEFQTSLVGRTVDYAQAELRRCLFAIDETLTEGKGGACLTLALTDTDPADDRIEIAVAGGVGRIAGANPCALLIAVYRFLFELGCRWVMPGEEGERLPKKALTPADLTVSVSETPSYRHRGVCIEGAVAEEHVRDMIEYMPRVGMNSYFIQFFRPATFFNRYYQHGCSLTRSGAPKTDEEIDAIHARLAEEIALRGLTHHAVGHGWTCVPFGLRGEGWSTLDEEDVEPAYLERTALVNGRRGLWGGCPLNTNLCFSQRAVRERITDAAVDYVREHPSIGALHVWLADASNNVCECEDCQKKIHADWYVLLLNELDEKLTAAGLDTKVVFLLYVDLLWAPQTERLKNPDRFLLMFAPITRSYSSDYLDGLKKAETAKTTPFVRNHLQFPSDLSENIAYLRQWQKTFSGDSFDFDYHLMWANSMDFGNESIARVMHADACALDKLGLNGLISCQLGRNGFPTTLPLYVMARGLWDKHSCYDAVADEYYEAAFGTDGGAVRAYLQELSRRFNYAYLAGERPDLPTAEMLATYRALPDYIRGFLAAHPSVSTASPNYHKRVIAHHADYCLLALRYLERRLLDEPREDLLNELRAKISAIEEQIEPSVDVWNLWGNTYVHRLK